MPKLSGETKALMGAISAGVVTIIGALAFLDMKSSVRMDCIEARLVRMEERIAADLADLKADMADLKADMAELNADMAELKGIMTGRGHTPAHLSGK